MLLGAFSNMHWSHVLALIRIHHTRCYNSWMLFKCLTGLWSNFIILKNAIKYWFLGLHLRKSWASVFYYHQRICISNAYILVSFTVQNKTKQNKNHRSEALIFHFPIVIRITRVQKCSENVWQYTLMECW